MKVSKSHPRFLSLSIRAKLEEGVNLGITSLNGLIAHGRGEAFDYVLGEKTHDFAKEAIQYAAAMLFNARNPVISVNGNTVALVPKELVQMSLLLNAPLEINLFHMSNKRLVLIKKHLLEYGATNVLLPEKTCILPHISSSRKYVNSRGIYKADVVLVPLEDGDRTEALIENDKKVIAIDLNPLSRTAQRASVTIVDNVVRAMPLLLREIEKQKKKRGIKQYDNLLTLKRAYQLMQENLSKIQGIS